MISFLLLHCCNTVFILVNDLYIILIPATPFPSSRHHGSVMKVLFIVLLIID